MYTLKINTNHILFQLWLYCASKNSLSRNVQTSINEYYKSKQLGIKMKSRL